MTKKLLSVLWVRLKQALLEVEDVGPPYPLTVDEWAHIQRQEEERAHLAEMKHWQLEQALGASQVSRR